MLAVLRGPRSRRTTVLLVGVLAVVLVIAVLGVVHVVREARRTSLDRALGTVPASSLRVSFTDWAAVREELRPKDVGTTKGLQTFLDRAFDRDLSAASTIDTSAVDLDRAFGFSPANTQWETFAQSRQGAVTVLRLDDDVDLDDVADRLDDQGYRAPKDDDGVWLGGIDTVAAIEGSIAPEMQYVVLDRDRHLVIASETRSYAASSAKVVRGDARSLADTGLAPLAARIERPVATLLWRAGFACEDLSMSQADGSAREEADRLVRAAGGVDSLDGMVASLSGAGGMEIAFGFENDEQAKANLRPRARLFVGPAAGRQGSYADDLDLTRSRTEGDAVLFDVKVKDTTSSPLTAVSEGPVLFATC